MALNISKRMAGRRRRHASALSLFRSSPMSQAVGVHRRIQVLVEMKGASTMRFARGTGSRRRRLRRRDGASSAVGALGHCGYIAGSAMHVRCNSGRAGSVRLQRRSLPRAAVGYQGRSVHTAKGAARARNGLATSVVCTELTVKVSWRWCGGLERAAMRLSLTGTRHYAVPSQGLRR